MVSTIVGRVRDIDPSTAVKAAVKVSSASNLTLFGLQTVDFYTLLEGDRILLRAQTDGTENGIWVASAGDWRRADDFNGDRDIARGTRIFVTHGTAPVEEWFLATDDPVIGTSTLTFTATGASAAAASATSAGLNAASAAASATAATASAAVFTNSFFSDRAAAEAASPPVAVMVLWVLHNGVMCGYQRATAGTALVTSGGQIWEPLNSAPAYLQHWGVTTYNSEAEALAAGAALTAGQRTEEQARIYNAFGEDGGELVIRGFVEFYDGIIANPSRIIRLDRGVEYDGLCVSDRFNLSAGQCFYTGLPATGGAEIVSFNIMHDHAVAAASADRNDLVGYPVSVRVAGDFNNIHHMRIQRAVDGFAATAAGATNNGGLFAGKIEIGAFADHINLSEALHFVDLESIDLWPYGFPGNANLMSIYNDGNTVPATISRMDNLRIGRLGLFQGGPMIFDTPTSGALPWQVDACNLDGSKAHLVLGRGQSQFDKVYGTETVDGTHEPYKIRVTNGHHTISMCDLVGDADALVKVEGGYLKLGGRLRQMNGNRAAVLVTGGVLDLSECTAEGLGVNQIASLVQRTGGEVILPHYAAQMFGAVGDGVTDDTIAMQQAIDFIGAQGGGFLHIKDHHLVTDQSTSPTTFDDRVCLHVLHDNVHLVGEPGAALKLADAQDAHMVKFGARAGSDVGATAVSRCSISGFSFDGNRANQTTPTDADYHGGAVDISEGCSDILVDEFHIYDTQYYGIGVQRDGVTECAIRNGLIERTGADGIDWKNDDGNGFGNVIDTVTVKRHGLASGLTTPQAGIDIRSGTFVTNFVVDDFGTGRGTVGIRHLENADSSFNADARSGFSDGFVRASTTSGTQGARIDALKSNAINIDFSFCGEGARISQREGQYFGLSAHDCVDGFVLSEGNNGTDGDNVALIACNARACSGKGFEVEADVQGANFIACNSRANGTGLSIASGAQEVRWSDGSITGNTTANMSDSGTNTKLMNIRGLRSAAAVTATVDAASTGTKTAAIAHTLDVTPAIEDVTLSLIRETAVDDIHVSLLTIESVDATNINVRVNIDSASATGGAQIKVLAQVEANRFG